jgi:hypothetical protein
LLSRLPPRGQHLFEIVKVVGLTTDAVIAMYSDSRRSLDQKSIFRIVYNRKATNTTKQFLKQYKPDK